MIAAGFTSSEKLSEEKSTAPLCLHMCVGWHSTKCVCVRACMCAMVHVHNCESAPERNGQLC